MKLTFIYPAVGKKPGEKYIHTWKMEPLTIATLKALTPKHVAVEFFDDEITDSPIVDEDYVVKGFFAVNYVF